MLFLYKTILYLKKKVNNSLIEKTLKFNILNVFFSCVDFRILYKNIKKNLYKFFYIFGLKNQKITFLKYFIKKKLTVNKSPFVNKKSKNQYEVRFFGSKVSYIFYSITNYYFFFFRIYNYMFTRYNSSNDYIKCLQIIYNL